MTMAETGRSYLSIALKIALGAGAVLGTAYLFSRLREKRDVEERLDRLERMLERLAASEDAEVEADRYAEKNPE